MQVPSRLKPIESPRQIIFEDFKIDLPISGGWGYDIESACVIDKNDPTVNKEMPFDGISIEYIFVEKRIYEEMIIFRESHEKYGGIRWNQETQQLLIEGDKKYDKLIFNVEGFSKEIWNELTSRFEAIKKSGKMELIAELDAYRESKIFRFKKEYFFDVTSFFGQNIIINKNKAINRSTLYDSDPHLLTVLNSATIQLFTGYAWQCEEINDETAVGFNFSAFEDPPSKSVAIITVADATSDLEEPDISLVEDNGVNQVDLILKTAIQTNMDIVEWTSSKINKISELNVLITKYKARDDGKIWQYVALRLSNEKKKYVIIGMFDVAKSNSLAQLVFKAMQSFSFDTQNNLNGLNISI